MSIPSACSAILQRYARAFQEGDFARCGEMFVMPAKIHVMDQSMQVASLAELEFILTAFRANLDVEDYARTEVKLLYSDDSEAGVCQLLVEWTNFNSRCGEINKMDLNLMFHRNDELGWRTDLIEVVCESCSNLTSGLPLH